MNQHVRARVLGITVLMSTGAPAFAQCPPVDPPQLVLDINRTTADAFPNHVADLGGVAVFLADDGSRGRELWRTDGTAAGTALVAELGPGVEDAEVSELAAAGSIAYLLRQNALGEFELWTTDASAAGTRRVITFPPAPFDDQPRLLVTVGSRAFFVAGPAELWTSDGSAAGTVRILDALVAQVDESVRPVAYQGRLYFAGFNLASGTEPWSTDGTVAGTSQLADLRPGNASSRPTGFAVVGTRLFFAANDGVSGVELHVTDGLAGGTALVADIAPGSANSSPSFIADAGGIAVFAASEPGTGIEPWRSDGTPAGTFLLGDLAPGWLGSEPEAFTASGARVLFRTANDFDGDHAWFVTDGSVAGTTYLTSLRECFLGSRGVSPLIAPVAGGWLVGDRDLVSGCEPWFLDGTAGVAVNLDVAPGSLSSLTLVETPFATFGTRALLALDAPSTGIELHVADGTGATLPADVNQDSQDSRAEAFVALGNRVVFLATDGLSGLEPWVSDGTPGGTLQLADVAPGPGDGVASLTGASGSLAYFLGRSPPGSLRLWKTDGTPAGTREVTSRIEASAWAPVAFRGGVLFVGTDPVAGTELMFSDGTDAGTRLAADIVPGPGSGAARLQAIVVSGDRAFLIERHPTTIGDDVFVTDGTPASTSAVLLAPDDGHSIGSEGALPWRGGIAVLRTSPEYGLEPWILEGDPVVARRAGDVTDPSTRGVNAGTLGLASGRLLFTNADEADDREPWVCDGIAPCERLADLATGGVSSLPEGNLNLGTRLVFSAIGDGVGRELFITDGLTPPERLTDIAPGAAGSVFTFLSSSGAAALFGARDPWVGSVSEAWLTDGTVAGTRPLGVMIPRSIRPSAPRSVAAGGRFFFAARDPVAGEEVFVLDPDTDGDGIADSCDPCPVAGSVPGADLDADGIEDACDACPSIADPSNADLDLDGLGDACDDDADADGRLRSGLPGIDADCDDLDASAGVLRAVSNLRVSGRDALRLSWTDEASWAGAGVAYDVIGGPLGPGVMAPAPLSGARCVQADLPLPLGLGIVVPGSNWLLVRAGLPGTTCGEGPTGSGPVPDAVACP